MRLQIVSDLHLEFYCDGGHELLRTLPNVADTLVVAGDLCGHDAILTTLDLLAQKWQNVVYVPGNHEFYRTSFDAVRSSFDGVQPWTTRTHRDNVYVLDNVALQLRGRRFVGTTLWFPESRATRRNKSRLNDFLMIDDFEARVYEENRLAVDFLEREVGPGDVVVTHHIPSPSCVPARFQAEPVNHFFVCDMDTLIRERKPALWIFGHTHDAVDKTVSETRCVCNPFGYPAEPTGFVEDLVIEV